MKPPVACLLLVAAAAAAPLAARETVGVYRGWAAFRDPDRCYAIAAPVDEGANGGENGGGSARWRPFASVGTWPARGLRSSLHLRLSRARDRSVPVTLSVGERRFTLVGSAIDAWAADAASDRAIVAALRSGRSMSVEAVARGGQPFADTYALPGAATAIDAALLACVAA